MRYVINDRKTTFAELSGRLFKVSGSPSSAATKEISEALLRANPHIRDTKNVAEGALIFVPALAKIDYTDRVRSIEGAGDEMLFELREMMAEIREVFEDSVEHAEQQTRKSLTILSSDPFKKVVEGDADVKNYAKGIEASAKTYLGHILNVKNKHPEWLLELSKDLAGLTEDLE